MATDYHLHPTGSIPGPSASRSHAPLPGSHGHYSTDAGHWDGQLPHAEVVDLANHSPEPTVANWPGIIQRLQWTRAVIRAHHLPPPQAAVLNEIAYRDGQGRGFTGTMLTLALDTGYNEKSIRRAIKPLQAKGLIIAYGNPGQKKLLGLPVKGGELPWPAPVRESADASHEESEPRTNSPELMQTPVRESGLSEGGQRPTLGIHSDTARTRQEGQREEHVNVPFNPTDGFGSVNRGAGPNADVIQELVRENWELLQDSGWQRLTAAIRHYQQHGLEYLRRDLQRKETEIRKADLAARTCVHCQTVHETPDYVQSCPKCEGLICVSEASSCRQHPCIRNPGGGGRTRGKWLDYQRR